MQIPFEQSLRVLVNEGVLHRKRILIAFVVTSVVIVLVGLVWPRTYVASITVIVDEKNIIQPLMQGTAVATDALDRAKIAREVIYARRTMKKIMADNGWLKDNPTPVEQENILKLLRARTTITNIGHGLIKIEYRDNDPQRAYHTTKELGDLFIAESTLNKTEESRDAYQFIDAQVKAYHEKLSKAEDQLKDFRSTHIESRPGSEGEISTRINQLETQSEQTEESLKEARIKQAALEKQLSGEAESTIAYSVEGQYRQRIAELQNRLETLRLNYTDEHPDVVHIRHQIDDLKDAIKAEEQKRLTAKSTHAQVPDSAAMLNPLYQQLRRELSDTKVNIETLKTRLDETRRLLARERGLAVKVHSGEAQLAELTRDYQVNRDIYQDLLRRRENARVSMSLDQDHQGLTFKIYEPPVVPLEPTGLRFVHFVIAAFVLGIFGPFAFIYAIQQFDPRVRFPMIVSEKLKLPVVANIPRFMRDEDVAALEGGARDIAKVVFATCLLIAGIVLLRVFQVV